MHYYRAALIGFLAASGTVVVGISAIVVLMARELPFDPFSDLPTVLLEMAVLSLLAGVAGAAGGLLVAWVAGRLRRGGNG